MPNPGDPANARQQRGGFHDQMPRWISRSPLFKSKSFGGIESKVMIYLIAHQDWHTHMVPLVGPTDLARALGFNRNRMSEAIDNLTLGGCIFVKKRGRKLSIKIIFDAPRTQTKTAGLTSNGGRYWKPAANPDTEGFTGHESELETGSNNNSPLSAEVKKLSASSEVSKNKWRSEPGKMANTATNYSGDLYPKEPPLGTDLNTESEPGGRPLDMAYEPGCDDEILNAGGSK